MTNQISVAFALRVLTVCARLLAVLDNVQCTSLHHVICVSLGTLGDDGFARFERDFCRCADRGLDCGFLRFAEDCFLQRIRNEIIVTQLWMGLNTQQT